MRKGFGGWGGGGSGEEKIERGLGMKLWGAMEKASRNQSASHTGCGDIF